MFLKIFHTDDDSIKKAVLSDTCCLIKPMEINFESEKIDLSNLKIDKPSSHSNLDPVIFDFIRIKRMIEFCEENNLTHIGYIDADVIVTDYEKLSDMITDCEHYDFIGISEIPLSRNGNVQKSYSWKNPNNLFVASLKFLREVRTRQLELLNSEQSEILPWASFGADLFNKILNEDKFNTVLKNYKMIIVNNYLKGSKDPLKFSISNIKSLISKYTDNPIIAFNVGFSNMGKLYE